MKLESSNVLLARIEGPIWYTIYHHVLGQGVNKSETNPIIYFILWFHQPHGGQWKIHELNGGFQLGKSWKIIHQWVSINGCDFPAMCLMTPVNLHLSQGFPMVFAICPMVFLGFSNFPMVFPFFYDSRGSSTGAVRRTCGGTKPMGAAVQLLIHAVLKEQLPGERRVSM